MPPRSARRTIRRLLLFVLLLYGGYLLLANLFVNLPLAATLVNRQPERFRMEWSRGLSLWPGHVALWDLSLQGHARRTRWAVQAQRASGQIALLPFAWRELRVSSATGNDLVVDIERVEENMPKREPADNGFVLHFPRVVVDTPLRATIEGVAVEGHATGSVGWRQQLRGGPMALFPSTLHLAGTRVARGADAWVHDAELTLDAAIEEHHRADFPGIGILQQLTARVRLQGMVNTLAIDYREPLPTWQVVAGQGTLTTDLTLAKGHFEPGGTLALLLPVNTVLLNGSQHAGDADLQFSVDDGLRLQVAIPPVDVLRSNAKLDLTLPSRELPLPPWKDHLQRIDGNVALHARFDSLGWITPLLERLKGLVLDGSGELRANLQIVDGALAEGSSVTVDRADMQLIAFDHRIAGSARAQADVIAGKDGQRTQATIRFDRFDIAAADAPDAPLGSGKDLVLDLAASGSLHELRDTISAQLQFSGAELPDLSRFNRYLPAHGARLLKGRGTLGATMRMDVPSNRSSGRIALNARAAGLRVGTLAFTSDVAVDAKLSDAKLGDLRFQAGGSSVSLRRARIDDPKGERDAPWWATLNIREGDISLARPLLVHARGEARMQDIGFVLSLFSAKKDFPKWIARLLDAGEATVKGQVHLVEREIVIDRVVASNDRFDVQARLRLGEDPPSGDLYARWGVLGLGMQLDRGERDMHLVGAKKWFEGRPNYIAE